MNEPNAPVLVGDMIPVTYNGTNWVKADINKNNWYDYNRGVWANAVTIKDSSKRAEYKNATVGTTIDLNYVNLMLVWIPRYSYTLRDQYGYQIEGASPLSINTPGAFDIKFIRTSTIETGSGKYTGTTPSNYYTPSSFCWGNSCDVESTRSNAENIELPGIWISKFELTEDMNNITSIPNKISIKGQKNKVYFDAIKNQINSTNGSNNYGLSGDYDTHMIKNTEWGAFAYLSQSKYGKYGNSNYTGTNKEIYINNYSGYQTGCSKGAPGTGANNTDISSTCIHKYDEDLLGTGASTTGTIYGIYDTVGGAFEKTMGNFNGIVSQSGFTTMPEAKYYNKYTTTVSIKGDAINADGTAGFYGDYQTFANSSNPWTYHSTSYERGVFAGVFSFTCGTGGPYTNNSARLAISTW